MTLKFILMTLLLSASLTGNAVITKSNSAFITSEKIKTTFVPSGDGQLFCRSIGVGKPLIVIHGGPGLTQDYLLPQMYELAKHNFVIFYDQRSCGKSTGEINKDTLTIESFVNDIEAIRKAYNLDQFSILGHSWGGFLAMQYTIKHQQYVDKLILSNSIPSTSEGYALFDEEYQKRMNPIQEEIKEISKTLEIQSGAPGIMEKLYRLIFSQYCYSTEKANALNLDMTSTALLNGNKINTLFRENVLHQPFNLNNDLNALKISTLVLHGDVDPIPPMTAKIIHENIPGSKYVLLQNCGHFPYVEQPAIYFKLINDFLNNNLDVVDY